MRLKRIFITSRPKIEALSSSGDEMGDDKDAFGNKATTARNTNVMDMI